MSVRDVAPIQLVVGFVGSVLLMCTTGIILLSVIGQEVPNQLATIAIASMTALGGLLAPNTGLLSSSWSSSRRETEAQTAAAAAAAAVATHTTALEQQTASAEHRADVATDQLHQEQERNKP